MLKVDKTANDMSSASWELQGVDVMITHLNLLTRRRRIFGYHMRLKNFNGSLQVEYEGSMFCYVKSDQRYLLVKDCLGSRLWILCLLLTVIHLKWIRKWSNLANCQIDKYLGRRLAELIFILRLVNNFSLLIIHISLKNEGK